MKKTLVKRVADFVKDKDEAKTWQIRRIDRRRPDSVMRTLRYLKEKFNTHEDKAAIAYVYDKKDSVYSFSSKFKNFLKKIG